MVGNFILGMMVIKKGALLTNKMSPLMVMILLDLIISLGIVIYYVSTGYGLLQMVFNFNAEILGLYILSD